jgi:uncharacterized damage-inducible protein DinB
MVGDLLDPRRSEPEFLLDERAMLEGWLEFHRLTLQIKCEGIDDAARKQRPVPSSLLSLHGLIRHMAEVERNWFQRVLAEDASARPIWFTEAEPDGDLAPLDDARWEPDFATWQEQCATSRSIAATRGLDDTGIRRGKPCSLRWIYTHMIEEYARHNGHADLIREIVDGEVGW